jgi:hypothetical protein
VTVRGTVTGATGANVAIQVRQGGWRTVKIAKLGPGGAFAASLKAARPGKLQIRAFYPGDDRSMRSVGTAPPVTVV